MKYEALDDEPVHEHAAFLFLLHLCMITAFWRFSFCSARIDGIRTIRYNFVHIHRMAYIYTSAIHADTRRNAVSSSDIGV